jgi:AcrR family transcriptional regulator
MIVDKLDQKKEDILDAAMHCLARYGIIKTTLDDIARLVGMNKATLYYYYKNKEAIFFDAMEREAQGFVMRVRKNFKTNSTAKDKIFSFLHTYHNYLRERIEIIELNAQAMVENHAFIRKVSNHMREKNIDLMREIIIEGINNGEFRRIDAGRVANILRYIFDLRRLEFFLDNIEKSGIKIDISQIEKDSNYILDIFLHGLIKID